MPLRTRALFALLVAGIVSGGCGSSEPSTSEPSRRGLEQATIGGEPDLSIIPTPKESSFNGSSLILPDTLRCHVSDGTLRPLIDVMGYEFRMLTGGSVEESSNDADRGCILRIDERLGPEEYRLNTSTPITIAGGSYAAASWVPLYVVNEKKWDPEYIYGWNLWRWENWVPWMPSYQPIQLEPSSDVIGGSMESWAQPQHVELWSLRKRVPSMNERIWSATIEPKRTWSAFARTLERLDAAFGRIISPVRVDADGLRYPGREDGHFNEPFRFGDRLTVRTAADSNLVVRYTVDGSEPSVGSPVYDDPIVMSETTDLRARAYTMQGEPIGYDRWIRYELHPIEARVEGDFVVGPDDAWETLGMQTEFRDGAVVTLRALRDGQLRYSVGDQPPEPDSPRYAAPLSVDSTVVIRAQLFEADVRVGAEWVGRFKKSR